MSNKNDHSYTNRNNQLQQNEFYAKQQLNLNSASQRSSSPCFPLLSIMTQIMMISLIPHLMQVVEKKKVGVVRFLQFKQSLQVFPVNHIHLYPFLVNAHPFINESFLAFLSVDFYFSSFQFRTCPVNKYKKQL